MTTKPLLVEVRAVGGRDAARLRDIRPRALAGVDPELRGHGVGEQLVAAVSAWASARGGRLLRLGVITAEGDATPF